MNDYKYMEENSLGYVRVLHAVPDAPNVDVYANDKLIAKNLAYSKYTDYMPLEEGIYNISLFATGDKSNPVLSNMLTLDKDKALTIAATGMLSDIGFLAITDENTSNYDNTALVRFAHLSPNAPAVDITLPDGTILFSDVSYKQVTPYIVAPPSTYTLQARLAGTPTVVLTVPDVKLESNKIHSVFAIGLVGETPELQALLIEDSVY